MAEKRKKALSICVKNGAMGSGTIEFFPAKVWGGADDVFRLRVDRKWIDDGYTRKQFYTPTSIVSLLVCQIFGIDLREKLRNPMPENMKKGVAVSVPTGDGCTREGTHISTESPFLGADGRWYVGCYLFGRGTVMIPCEEVRIK